MYTKLYLSILFELSIIWTVSSANKCPWTFLAILNCAVMNMGVHLSFRISVFVFLG